MRICQTALIAMTVLAHAARPATAKACVPSGVPHVSWPDTAFVTGGIGTYGAGDNCSS